MLVAANPQGAVITGKITLKGGKLWLRQLRLANDGSVEIYGSGNLVTHFVFDTARGVVLRGNASYNKIGYNDFLDQPTGTTAVLVMFVSGSSTNATVTTSTETILLLVEETACC